MTDARLGDGTLTGLELTQALFEPGTDLNAWARDAVDDYFQRNSGRAFERLESVDRNRFEPADIVAVSLLGVAIPGEAALHVLGAKADELSALLGRVPDIDLHQVKWSVLAPGSAADRLWTELHEIHGMGPTSVAKLLARKRPKLIPIFDERVHRRMESPARWWESCWCWWGDPRNVEAVASFRDSVGGVDDISLLRIWDVAVWQYDRAVLPHVR